MCVCILFFSYFFFFKQKTAYEMRISDWSSDVCSSDLLRQGRRGERRPWGSIGNIGNKEGGNARDRTGRLGDRRLAAVAMGAPGQRPCRGRHLSVFLLGGGLRLVQPAAGHGLVPRGVEDRKSVVSGTVGVVRCNRGG